MTTPEPKPKRSRRMVVWLVAMPTAILLLALAGANWKRFHLAYAKHLMRSDDRMTQWQGVDMVLQTHLREGMSLEEVRRLLAPARVSKTISFIPPQIPPLRPFKVSVKANPWTLAVLSFDADDRLRWIASLNIPHGK